MNRRVGEVAPDPRTVHIPFVYDTPARLDGAKRGEFDHLL